MVENKILAVGDKAPDFSLIDQDNKIQTLTSQGGKYVVIYFYPKDDTPGCTKQACGLRDNFNQFSHNNITVFGINYDSPQSHKKFIEKYRLPFTLLSDSNKEVAKAYGAKNRWFIPVPHRMTFVVNPQGIICAILPSVDVSTHASAILEIIARDQGQIPRRA